MSEIPAPQIDEQEWKDMIRQGRLVDIRLPLAAEPSGPLDRMPRTLH